MKMSLGKGILRTDGYEVWDLSDEYHLWLFNTVGSSSDADARRDPIFRR